ncbi:Transcription factor TFIIIB component B [Entomortierella beljakovae]|nr:Transcription factor TFIIIB component B [Entomortierella beljakovae]
MSSISTQSTRIDKGQKRFQPKLKARPNRNKTAASEDGTPAPTPSISGSDSGSFGASLFEQDTPGASSASIPTSSIASAATSVSTITTTLTSATVTTSTTAATTSTSISTETVSQSYSTIAPSNSIQNESIQRPSIATQISPATIGNPITSPHPPHVSQSTAISIPVQRPSDASSSVIPNPSAATSSKPTKGTSITVPSARVHADIEETDDTEDPDNLNSSRKRSKGKSHRPREQPLMYSAEEAEELMEDGEELMPDYANMYMYQFTRDLGVGKRSKVYQEHQKLFETKRRINKRKQRIKAIREMEGRSQPSFPVPGYMDDEDDEDNEDEDIKGDENGGLERYNRAKSEAATPKASQQKTFAPQVRIIDGRIEVDADSLVVDHDVVEADTNQGPMEYVEESSSTKFVNSATFNRKIPSERWSEKDTDIFYEANLDKYSKMIGTEFPEVSGEDLIKKLAELDEDEQEALGTPGLEEYEEEVVQDIVQEEDAEEIVGMIE